MNDRMIFAACALALIAAYALHGRWLAHRWGVDPGRKTPALLGAAGRRQKKRIGASVLVCTASCLWMGLCLYVYVCDMYGARTGALAVTGTALLSGVIAFAALFVCVRTGGDLAQAAGEELFPAAKKMMYAFGMLAMLLFFGFAARFIFTDTEFDGKIMLGCAVIWVVMAVMTASGRIAPAIRNERHMRPAAYGGAICTGVLTLAACVAAEGDEVIDSPIMIVLGMAAMLAFYVYSLCLAGDGVRGLLKSPMPKRKRIPNIFWTFLCAACGVMLGMYGGVWMLSVSCAAGAAYVLLAALTCTRWFYRIGRGLFSRN